MSSHETKTPGGPPAAGFVNRPDNPVSMYPPLNPPPYEDNPSAPSFNQGAPGPGGAPAYGGPSQGAPPPPPGAVPAAGAYVTIAPVGPNPTPMTCPSCRAQIVTRVDRESSTRTHLIAALLCVAGCWPCCLIPYCMDSCQSATHYCPNCGTYLGIYKN